MSMSPFAWSLAKCITVLGFSTLNDVEDYLSSADHAQLERGESALLASTSEFWTAANYSIINRLYPEMATEIER